MKPVVILALLLVGPGGAAAQAEEHRSPAWVSDVGIAGANIAAGAVTAALTAAMRGNDVADAFLKGAVGGGGVFAGKRLAVERFSGAGLLGRQIASVGSSVVANAGAGRAWADEVWLPAGPLWFQVRSASGLRARLNLQDVGTLLWAATRSELHFDLERTISNGSAVFVARNHEIHRDSDRIGGFTRGGVVVLGVSPHDLDLVQRHENVHVLQHDYLMQTLHRPLEAWGWRHVTRREIPIDLGLLTLLPSPGVLRALHQHEAEALELR